MKSHEFRHRLQIIGVRFFPMGFPWQEQLPKMLEGRTTPMVTNCVLEEFRSLGDRALGAAIIAKG